MEEREAGVDGEALVPSAEQLYKGGPLGRGGHGGVQGRAGMEEVLP